MSTLLILLPTLAVAASTSNAAPVALPARFDADLVHLVAPLAKNGTLTLYTDTGGGLFLGEAAVKRLGLATEELPPGSDAPPGARAVRWPAFRDAIPPPPGDLVPVMPAQVASRAPTDSDGMLGQAWFGGRVWTWDYPARRFALEGANWKPAPDATRVALGFKADAAGARATNFPRITVRIDGQPIDLLLDTGAMTRLTPAAMNALGDALPAVRATSMIADTQFKAWRSAHPDWRVIEDAQEQSHAAMIEVPSVEIAGHAVGPVWFTWRPDRNFHEFMSGMMDGRIEGALGGNALRHFVMTVDYPGAAAWFRCRADCAVKPRPAP
ncbi:MAG: hypothetical protein GXC76_05775 [Rhodanobacteraceae bacterium]|jgi:hypothetical protein|nr:hypothetical protein [Rhodanobacteraceae bacterium]